MLLKYAVSFHPSVNGYWLYTPEGWDGVTKLPTIIFFHGLGQCGTNLDSVLSIGLPALINRKEIAPNAIVMIPQSRNQWPGWFFADSVINYVLKTFPVDPDRLTLTGLSMGGGVVLDFVEGGDASKIAAIAPVCPASSFNMSNAVKHVANKVAFYFTHSDPDGTTPFSNSVGWVDGLNALGASPKALLRKTTGGHNGAWDQGYYPASLAYDGKNLVDWLLAQKRGAVVTPPPVDPDPTPATKKGLIELNGKRITLFSNNTFTEENI